MYLSLFALLLTLGVAPMASDHEPPVGFIWHFPFVDVGTDQVKRSGATAMIARVPWGVVERTQGQYDFSSLDRQIEEAERGGYRLVLLLECNPFCVPEWLSRKAQEAGESVMDGAGAAGREPRTASPLFARAEEEWIRRVLAHVRERDRQRVITHYQAGIEWWFPDSFRYAPADIRRFRGWLQKRYSTIQRLNDNWSSSYRAFEEIQAPRIYTVDLWQNGRQGPGRLRTQDDLSKSAGNYDAISGDWHLFWYETAAEFINFMARLVKKYDSTRPTLSFLTFSFAISSEWDYVQWSAVHLDEVARRGRYLDALGMQLCAASGDPYRITAGLDVARKYGKPLYVLDLLDFTLGVHAGFSRMEKATHAAVQHGATGLFYCCWNGAKDFNFYPDWKIEDLNRMLTDGRRAIRLMQDMKVRSDTALILPILPSPPLDENGYKNDPASFIGWYKLLESLHIPVDVVTLQELERDPSALKGYSRALVPDCAFLPEKAAEQLAAFRRRGGHLFVSERFARFDPARRPLDRETLFRGLAFETLPDYGKRYAGPLIRKSQAGDTPPLTQWRDETPEYAALRRQAAERILTSLRKAAREREIEFLTPGERITATLFTGRHRRALYLVNMAEEPAKGERLRWKVARTASVEALADLQPVVCKTRQDGEWLEVALPAFRTSCIIRANLKRD
jgi:hypothetical protein